MRVENGVTKYIADDGSVFFSESECLDYEQKVIDALEAHVEDLYVSELENTNPVFMHKSFASLSSYSPRYRWFRLSNSNDFNRLINTMRQLNNKFNCEIKEPTTYPNLIALEQVLPKRLLINCKYKYTGRYLYYLDDIDRINEYINKVQQYLNE